MDPLTHTLLGANLSEKSRFAAAALLVGANIPDVDGVCYLIDGDLALGFRRGWTHGVQAIGGRAKGDGGSEGLTSVTRA